ncbi:MAG: hypothetical protein K8S21_01155 [Gemmatimonadetes bacterium]|nr:hypothetical protein [Gemmatimonadota bacterium]
MTPWRRLLFAVAVLSTGTADAQVAADTTRREPVALVAFTPNRIGLLIPLGQRWMLRPDYTGSSAVRSYWDEEWSMVAGLTVIRRTPPTEQGWTYLALRYGVLRERDGSQGPIYLTQYLTGSWGGHAQLRDWFGLFGEAGASVSYFDETGNVIVEFDIASRVGMTLRRPPRTPK